MNIKIDFPKNITANSLHKVSTQYSTSEELSALGDGRLVVAWDEPKDEENPPIRFYGFLEEILFKSNCSVKYGVFCPRSRCTLHFGRVKLVQELACPKVYYNDGVLQGVGHLVGIKEYYSETFDKHIEGRVRVAPWNETAYRTVDVGHLTFVENIPLGLTKKDDEETDNVH